VLSFPAATIYTSDQYGNTIQASGAGSRVDLSALATLIGATRSSSWQTQIKALAGGKVDLAGQISGWTTLTVDTNASTLNLEKITRFSNATLNANNGGVLTFPAASRIDWVGTNTINTTGTGSSVVNQGVLSVATSGAILTITANDFTNYGTIEAGDGASIDIHGFITVATQGQLKEGTSGTITISGNLSGGTQNADQYNPQGQYVWMAPALPLRHNSLR